MSNVWIGVLSGQQFGILIPPVVEVYYELAIPFCIQLVAAAEPQGCVAFFPFCAITLKAGNPQRRGRRQEPRRKRQDKEDAVRLHLNRYSADKPGHRTR